MAKLSSSLLLLPPMVLLLVQLCLSSPISYVPRDMPHLDLPLPLSPPHTGALYTGLQLQVHNLSPGEEDSYDWRDDGTDFPNPWYNPEECNSGVKKHGKDHAFACDPDKNLQENDVTDLSLQIEDIVSQTKCQCAKGCSTHMPMGRFSIGIAVASNITGSSDSDNIRKMKTFSDSLRNKHWSIMKRCNDFLVIALEVNSRTVYMNPDRIVSEKISNKCALEILEKTKQYFVAEDYNTGLREILQYVKNALMGGECGQKPGELSAGAIVGIVFGVIIGVALIAGLIVCCVGFFRNWDCVINTCIGLVIGMVLGCIQGFINAMVFACVSAACEALGCEPCCECEPLECVSGEDGGGGAGLEY